MGLVSKTTRPAASTPANDVTGSGEFVVLSLPGSHPLDGLTVEVVRREGVGAIVVRLIDTVGLYASGDEFKFAAARAMAVAS